DDRHVGTLAQRSRDVQAIDRRQAKVEDDEIWLLGARECQGISAVAGNHHLETRALEIVTTDLRNPWLVVHNQNLLHHSSLRGASPLGLPNTLARGGPRAPLRSRGLTRCARSPGGPVIGLETSSTVLLTCRGPGSRIRLSGVSAPVPLFEHWRYPIVTVTTVPSASPQKTAHDEEEQQEEENWEEREEPESPWP